MQDIWFCILEAALISYLMGSLNFAIIVSRLFYGKDIRSFGSGNAGMTNVLRTFGKGAAALTIIGDIGKGVLSVLLTKWFFSYAFGDFVAGAAYIACICVILGHLFPIYFKFKGGKGVSVAAGAIIAIEPILLVALLTVFIIVFLCSKMVSLASIICAVCYPFFTLIYALIIQRELSPVIALSILPAALVVFMHKDNIKRIIAGNEYRFGQKKDK